MEDHYAVFRLIANLSEFFTEGIVIEEDSRYPLLNEFHRNIQDVIFTKQLVVYSKYQKFFNTGAEVTFSSPEMFLSDVFYACLKDALLTPNIFERFLNAFALILRISIETRLRTRANFCIIVPIMFMELYQEKMAEAFVRQKGFWRLIQYVNDPNYLESKCIMRNISCTYNPNFSVSEISNELREKVILMGDHESSKGFRYVDPKIKECSSFLAKSVLESTEINRIPLPSYDDLNVSVYDLIQQKRADIKESLKFLQLDEKTKSISGISEEGETKTTKECFPNLDLVSKIKDDASKQMTDDEQRFENIIEAIIKHNHSKSSSNRKSKSCILTKADEILENLKRTIKSISEVLDESDKKQLT